MIVITEPFLIEVIICLKLGFLISDISWNYSESLQRYIAGSHTIMPPWADMHHFVKTDTASITINQVSTRQYFKVAFNLRR